MARYLVGHGNCEPIRAFERITVTRLEVLAGDGEQGNPYRVVETWVSDDGKVIAHFDPTSPSQGDERE